MRGIWWSGFESRLQAMMVWLAGVLALYAMCTHTLILLWLGVMIDPPQETWRYVAMLLYGICFLVAFVDKFVRGWTRNRLLLLV